MFFDGSVSVSGTGRIRLECPRLAMRDTEPILTGMAPCPALHFSYQFLGCKKVQVVKSTNNLITINTV